MSASGLLLDSLDAFWSVAEQLADGEPVDERAWDALFRTTGYQALASEFPPRVLRPRFELAFARGREETARVAAGNDWLVAHYLRVKEERHGIQAFVSCLDATTLFSEATRHCSRWIPLMTVKDAPLPSVALAIFEPDARGYDTVVVDAGFARHLGEMNFTLLLAHEFHHWCRNRARGDLAMHPRDLAWVLDQIQAEGVADQINVPAFLGEGGLPSRVWPGWAERYRKHLEHAPAFLTYMDGLLGRMARSPETAEEEARHLRESLPMAGHPVGYHMACRIVEAGLREALVSAYANPIVFFQLYAEACRRQGIPCELTGDSLTYLDGLQMRQ